MRGHETTGVTKDWYSVLESLRMQPGGYFLQPRIPRVRKVTSASPTVVGSCESSLYLASRYKYFQEYLCFFQHHSLICGFVFFNNDLLIWPRIPACAGVTEFHFPAEHGHVPRIPARAGVTALRRTVLESRIIRKVTSASPTGVGSCTSSLYLASRYKYFQEYLCFFQHHSLCEMIYVIEIAGRAVVTPLESLRVRA